MWESLRWAFRDDDYRELSDTFLLTNRDNALRHYDLSIAYFGSLDRDDFEASLEQIRDHGTLQEVAQLSDWADAEGVYVMVFDDYKQYYVGKANDIRARVKQHWGARKPFDRLLFGTVYSSVFPVDELRALDNTRIFAARSRDPFTLEQSIEALTDPRFSLNRMVGGEASPMMLALAALSPRKRVLGSAERLEPWDTLESAESDIDLLCVEARSGTRDDVAEQLAILDMSVFMSAREDGSTVVWSRRDLVNEAARDGKLTVSEFEQFLALMGETVVWPPNDQR